MKKVSCMLLKCETKDKGVKTGNLSSDQYWK